MHESAGYAQQNGITVCSKQNRLAARAVALLACIAFIPVAGLTPAAHADTPEGQALLPVTVTGTRLERELPDTPGAVTVIDEQALREARQGLQLDEALTRVPGIYLQNRYNFAQGQRIASRGFGARAPFGVRGIRILVDGFPETLPDGQSQIDSVDLDSVVRAEVLRGPSSVLYGNAGGGVIAIDTAQGSPATPAAALRLQGGSDSFRKAHLASGGIADTLDYHVSMSHLDFDGFREQSAVRKTLFNTRLGLQVDDHQRLEFVLTALDLPKAEDPGGLDAEQVAEDRRQALSLARNLDAGQVVKQQRLGLRYIHADTLGGEVRLQGFYSNRNFSQQLPFPGASLVGFSRDFSGAGIEYRAARAPGGLPVRYVVGTEAQRQKDDRDRFNVAFSGEVGDLTQQELQKATVLAAFAQADVNILPRTTLSLGGRIDRLRLSIDDRLVRNGDDSGARNFTETSGSAGIVWRAVADHRLYASVSTAFESPSFTEFARPDGGAGFNPDIQPQESVNREIGVRNGLGGVLHYDLTAFSVRVDDEIVPFEVVEGRTFFENAGRTDRDGVELTTLWRPVDSLTVTASYSYARYRFKRFVDLQGENQSGNRLPGLPRQTGFLEFAWQDRRGLFIAADGFFAGQVFADNANTERVASYVLANLRAGYRPTALPQLELFGGVSNLLDRDYFANIRINANADRFFEPAPGRIFHAGLAMRY